MAYTSLCGIMPAQLTASHVSFGRSASAPDYGDMALALNRVTYAMIGDAARSRRKLSVRRR
jgi:hypothetical protein